MLMKIKKSFQGTADRTGYPIFLRSTRKDVFSDMEVPWGVQIRIGIFTPKIVKTQFWAPQCNSYR
jgi:hypothetical protein